MVSPYSLPPIYFSTVITRENYQGIKDIIQLAHDCNVRHINFQPLNFESNFPDLETKETKKNMLIESENANVMQDEIKQSIKLAKKLKVSTNLEVVNMWVIDYCNYSNSNIYFFDKVLKNHVCSKPFNYIHINYYGELLPCSLINNDLNIVGKDIKSAWQGMAKGYRNILLQKRYFKECHSCFCDFPTNFRLSLTYHPFKNITPLLKLLRYYIKRTLL